MGQYHLVVNLDKKEYLDPHQLGAGLKLWEQLANHPGTSAALIPLLAVSNGRGGGDLQNHPGADEIIGRWGGDRIAIVGDYAEPSDLPTEHHAEHIWMLCVDDYSIYMARKADIETEPEFKRWEGDRELLKTDFQPEDFYTDISEEVCKVLEAELEGDFKGDGWRKFQRKEGVEIYMTNREIRDVITAVRHDLPGLASNLEHVLKRRESY